MHPACRCHVTLRILRAFPPTDHVKRRLRRPRQLTPERNANRRLGSFQVLRGTGLLIVFSYPPKFLKPLFCPVDTVEQGVGIACATSVQLEKWMATKSDEHNTTRRTTDDFTTGLGQSGSSDGTDDSRRADDRGLGRLHSELDECQVRRLG